MAPGGQPHPPSVEGPPPRTGDIRRPPLGGRPGRRRPSGAPRPVGFRFWRDPRYAPGMAVSPRTVAPSGPPAPAEVTTACGATFSPTDSTWSSISTGATAPSCDARGPAASSSTATPTTPRTRSATTTRGCSSPRSASGCTGWRSTSRPIPTSTPSRWRGSWTPFRGSRSPGSCPHAFFVAGGSVAVENAVKTAFDWKVRKNLAAGRGERGSRIVHFRHAFHGRTGYALSLTNTEPMKVAYFPKFDWPRIESPMNPLSRGGAARRDRGRRGPRRGRDRGGGGGASPRHRRADHIEPIQCEGGDHHFRREFFGALRRLADEHEFLLILDEVQTGVGMTGRMWCHEHFGVVPDVLAFGKKAQVCGILAGPRAWTRSRTTCSGCRPGSTRPSAGNLVDMVRFGRYLEIIEEERLVENAIPGRASCCWAASWSWRAIRAAR